MAATVSVKEATGAGPTNTTITNSRLKTADDSTQDTNNPLVVPSSGVNWSYWKSHFLNADTTPSGTINNIKWYTDGAIGWTGVVLRVGTTPTYTQATGTEGTTGNESSVATASADRYTSADPRDVGGSISNPSTGKISDYVVLQAMIRTTAQAGTLAQETLTFRYDET